MPSGHYKHANAVNDNPALLPKMLEFRKTMTYDKVGKEVGMSGAWVATILRPFEPPRKHVWKNGYTRATVFFDSRLKRELAREKKAQAEDWTKRWPCGEYKANWNICYTGCLNRFECGAFEKGKANVD